ncbi:MAG: hypothetical protein ACPL0C_06210 [Candidatus Bathyarchaeales archaeon]
MKAAIRMISIATAFFWIFLAAFTISAVYSFVKDVRLNFGELETPTNLTEENEVVLCLPITVENKGLFNIGSFNITTEISDFEGFVIACGNTFIPVIGRNTFITIRHNVTVNVAELFQENTNLIFNDTTFTLYEAVGMSVAEAIPFTASTNITFPWGAPLYNLEIGEPEYVAVNRTHTLIRTPINFENHAFFDIIGNLSTRMYDFENVMIGETQTVIEAPSQTVYSGYAEICVKNTVLPSVRRFEFYFQTPVFNVKIGEVNID